eukprot:4800779-Lingulodinium_polyedra.AAC.1
MNNSTTILRVKQLAGVRKHGHSNHDGEPENDHPHRQHCHWNHTANHEASVNHNISMGMRISTVSGCA